MLSRWLLTRLLATATFLASAFGEDLDKFEMCKIRIDRIMNGTETFGTINNHTISQYLYKGKVGGMNPEYARTSRDKFLTLTTEGCQVICEDPIDWYWQTNISLTLSIISNWILPIIALLAALPYDSLHRRNAGASCRKGQGRFWGTFAALLNWLGSPQTALTATLFNIHQTRKCRDETLPSGQGISGNDALRPLKNDAYYVLTCVGQFMPLESADTDRHDFLEALIYGLFNPLCDIIEGEQIHAGGAPQQPMLNPPRERAQQMTTELLREMAFQLRMLRRRGVYPMFLSIFLFFIAYAVSIVLAFGDLGGRTTAHSLAFGILISWLPLLVLFAILDRNPISAERCRTLISRWMWNVAAVRQWVDDGDDRPEHPRWWPLEKDPATQGQGNAQVSFDTFMSDFAGQGRKIAYNGLPYAVMHTVYSSSGHNRTMRSLQTITDELKPLLDSRRPRCWWIIAFTSLGLIWLEIGMAFMISFNIPTVGIGCRSGSYLIYRFLSSITWLIHLWPPSRFKRAACLIFCFLSTLVLGFIVFAAFSGILKNCSCRGGIWRYVDFENAEFYRNTAHFDVAKWWKAAAIVAALPLVVGFIAAVVLLGKLQGLWQASEQSIRSVRVDMQWLI